MPTGARLDFARLGLFTSGHTVVHLLKKLQSENFPFGFGYPQPKSNSLCYEGMIFAIKSNSCVVRALNAFQSQTIRGILVLGQGIRAILVHHTNNVFDGTKYLTGR
jgi:hypothetical protein